MQTGFVAFRLLSALFYQFMVGTSTTSACFQADIPAIFLENPFLLQAFQFPRHGAPVYAQVSGQVGVGQGDVYLCALLLLGETFQIGQKLLPGSGSGKDVDPLHLLPGLQGDHLEQVADQLAVVPAGVLTALDHMGVINEYDPGLLLRLHVIILGIRREQKGFSEYRVFFQFINHILISFFIAVIQDCPAGKDQANFIHGMGICKYDLVVLEA